MNNPTWQELFQKPYLFLAFGFGSGLSPKAPGTIGTLAAIPLYWLIKDLPTLYYAIVVVVAFVLGCWICEQASRSLKVHDHGGIVWDEFVGYWLTMFMAPSQWWWIVLGFVLFRFFDVVKPWPIKWADKKVQGGFGIMIDDVIAGVFAAVGLHICVYAVGVF